MANENKNMNELVADDEDPTAELEALTVRHAFGPRDPALESDANTFDIDKLDGEVHEGVSVANLKSDLKMRSETIERLQFDIEQLHSKWLGLETEIKAREEVTSNLNAELKSAERKLERKATLLEKRDQTIKSLKSELRERDNEVRNLQLLADQYLAEKTELEAGDEISIARQEISRLEALVANQVAELRDAVAQQQRTEHYADELRRQLTDINQQTEARQAEQDRAIEAATAAVTKFEALEREYAAAEKRAQELADTLKKAEDSHAEELRTLRFELGEAQETLAENQQEFKLLASDLVDTRGSFEAAEKRADELADTLKRAEVTHAEELQLLRVELGEAQEMLAQTREESRRLASDLEDTRESSAAAEKRADELADALKRAEETHAEELRTVRFELGEAQETLAENQKVTEELTSDLIDTRGFKERLEQALASNEEASNRKIDDLEKQVGKLTASITEYEYKLDKKSEAINTLLAELAKKSQEIDSIGEMEDVIQEIDDRMSERIDDRARAPSERVTRLLVGKFDDQELRFPLFKDRLTIGRTNQNDIQLDAPYISRRHAVVATEGDATRLIDWGSKNGVYVNSRRVTEHFLKNGDIVTIGNAKFRYEERPKRDA